MSGKYDAVVEQLKDDSPPWLSASRQKGLDAWADATMPTAKDEDWRYIDIDFSLDDFRPTPGPSSTLPDSDYLAAIGSTDGKITMVDGHVVSAAADLAKVGSVGAFDDSVVEERYGSTVGPGVDLFAAAHHALSPAGSVVLIPRGTQVDQPVVVDVQSSGDGSVSFPHVSVIARANSEASVVVVYRSAPDDSLLAIPVLEAFVEDGARLKVSVVQEISDVARMVAYHQYVIGRDATIRIDEVGLGGRYARQRLGIDLDGAGSSVRMGGIYFGDKSQTLDYRINVTHRGPQTTSNIFLKGAVADDAQAVWTGLMRIEHGANGTSAFETNRNLVLSDGGKVNSVPNLEILTDDLQCGHASSSGPLDEDHLYYLMSRGIHRDRAERLLVRGFFDEILSALATPALADPARDAVATKFAAAQQRERS